MKNGIPVSFAENLTKIWMKISMYEWSRVKTAFNYKWIKKIYKKIAQNLWKSCSSKFYWINLFVFIIFYEYDHNSDPIPSA